MENPKARNKKESNTKSNLNQTNKKTQQNYISYPIFFFLKGGKRIGVGSDNLMVADI